MNPLEQAVIKTFTYADIFDYPLTAAEIHRYLIVDNQPPSSPKLTFNSLAAALSNLIQAQQIIQQEPYYALTGRHQIFKLRQTRELISQVKLTHAESIIQKLAHFPFVRGIFVTGTLAMHNADHNDDIDLLIIIQADRLWLTRFLITLYLDLTGQRRRPDRSQSRIQGRSDPRLNSAASPEHRDKLCLNMWLDESSLALPRSKRNLYTAHEVAQVVPILDKDQIYTRFMTANTWINRYLPHVSSILPPKTESGSAIGRSIKLPLKLEVITINFVNSLESFLFRLQHFYMHQKITREIITPHAAFFHPRDTGSQILDQYQTKLDQISAKKL